MNVLDMIAERAVSAHREGTGVVVLTALEAVVLNRCFDDAQGPLVMPIPGQTYVGCGRLTEWDRAVLRVCEEHQWPIPRGATVGVVVVP